jgi:hypothetical protein
MALLRRRLFAPLLGAVAIACGARGEVGSTNPGAGAAPRAALWSKHVGPGEVNAVAFGASGNLVVVGTIQGNFVASLGGGAGDPLRADGFVTELDRAGNVVWLHRWTNLGGHVGAPALAVRIDDAGIWALGIGWPGITDVGGGSVSLPESPQEGSAFLVHYADSGAFVSTVPLALPASCQGSTCDPTWMGFDDAGGAYWTTTVVSQPSGQSTQVALTKCDTQGRLLWSRFLPKGSSGSQLTVSGTGMIAVPGNFALTIFGADGSQRWSRQFQWAPVLHAAFDGAGDVIVGGTFAGAIDLGGPAPLQSPAHDGQAPGDEQAQPMFLAKYDAGGHYSWSHAFGSTARAQSLIGAIGIAPNQDVLFAGGFAGAVDFGSGAYQTNSDSQDVGSHDVFVARVGPDGAPHWSAAFGDGSGLGDTGSCLAVAPDGRVAMGGLFDGSIDFGNGPFNAVGTYGDQWGPGGDGFIAVFAP